MPFVAGLAVGASFGPVNLMLTSRALTSGMRAAVWFATGALTGDLVLLAGGMVTGQQMIRVLTRSGYWSPATICLGTILTGLAALGLWRSKSVGVSAECDNAAATRNLVLAVAITVLNPLGAVMWFTVGSIMAAAEKYASNLRITEVALWTFSGDLAWFVTWTLALSLFRKILKPKHIRLLGVLAYLMLSTIGILTLVSGIRTLGHGNAALQLC